SRAVAAWCNRHGTRAAPAMQPNTTNARTSPNSPNSTSAASANPAVKSTMAEWRNRSGQGEKMDEEDASTVIGIAVSLGSGSISDAGTATLVEPSPLRRRPGLEDRRHRAEAFQSCPQDNLSKRQ